MLELLLQFRAETFADGEVHYMFLHPFSMNAIARGHKMQLFPVPGRVGHACAYSKCKA